MSQRTSLLAAIVAVFLLIAGATTAREPSRDAAPQRTPVRSDPTIHGGPAGGAKAAGDTILLMGPTGAGAPYLGDFEAGWNGWTSRDVTGGTVNHWQVSSFARPDPFDLAAICFDPTIPACGPGDTIGGYGNAWDDLFELRVPVADPAVAATVVIQGGIQMNSEPGYDYAYLTIAGGPLAEWTTVKQWESWAISHGDSVIDETFSVLPAEYEDGAVRLVFRFRSDGGFSSADCLWPSDYAARIDDLAYTVSQAGHPDITGFTDFQDGTFGDWTPIPRPGAGNFAKRWQNLADEDPCAQNATWQVAFIDDGVVVPGTGGSPCVTWCYGPGGYVVNTTNGLDGSLRVHTEILSPVMDWPAAAADGIVIAFDVYRHEELTGDSPGVFFSWDVRSADTDNSAGNGFQDIEDQGFLGRSFAYYGGPDYLRVENDVTDLMAPGRDQVQLNLAVNHLGPYWGFTGHDATPAPYFDNVAVKVYDHDGPALVASEADLAQSAFPAADTIDMAAPGALSVRFDVARAIIRGGFFTGDPGDSVVVRVVPVRAGAVLTGSPAMHYVIAANPLFDAYRTTPTSGVVAGKPATNLNGTVDPERWAFDLPDTGTLFPGDVLHYYITASDEAGGDVRTAVLPRDLTGFGDFGSPPAYDRRFVMRALPSLAEDVPGFPYTPDVLFWNDAPGRGGDAAWETALRQIELDGPTLDIYETRAPHLGVDNGIGDRTAGPSLDGYSVILYTADDLDENTLTDADIAALQTWLAAGNRHLLVCGDDLVASLSGTSAAAATFRDDFMGVDLVTDDLRPLLGGQVAPLVLPLDGNAVFQNVADWYAYGSCPTIRRFDAVTPRAGALRLAEFTDPSGTPGLFAYSAATLNVDGDGNQIVSLPYDLSRITYPQGGTQSGLTRAAAVLQEIINAFGVTPGGVPAPVPEAVRFTASAAPTPFNPRTTISWTRARDGDLQVKVYDLRGALVRVLHDGPAPATGQVAWLGRDDAGRAVASGVYFYEVRSGAEVKVGKVALLK
ncbi:hypothetical protein KDM41_17390 [bacterium]|nr:hypothetical protein [bacterium]